MIKAKNKFFFVLQLTMQHIHRLKLSREGRGIFVSRATQLKKRRALGTRLGGRATGNLLPRFSLSLVPWRLAKLVNGLFINLLESRNGYFLPCEQH